MNRYTNEPDDNLVSMTLLGEEEAFEALVLRYERAVRGAAFSVTNNRFSAEDAAQDAFVSAWMKLDSLSDGNKFGAWVCRIAKNCARNMVIRYRNRAADISFHLLENLDETAGDESGLLSALRDEGYDDLHAAVASLSEKIRETVTLHYFEGLSVEEIATRLSLPVGTVKWRLYEGRKQLRKEFGVMNEKENETLVARVMRRVEELKLWRLKNDKSGFEAEYREVLSAVEGLPESREKESALAEVLMHGYWWVPSEENKEMVARIKAAAEKSDNEEVMQFVIASEQDEYHGMKCIEFIRDTQIPYLEGKGYRRALGHAWFWLGYTYFEAAMPEEGYAAYRKVLELLKPDEIYYACARSGIDAEKLYAQIIAEGKAGENAKSRVGIRATAEELRLVGGNLYFWQQPGYSRSSFVDGYYKGIVYLASRCDHKLVDTTLGVGESVTASDGKVTLTFAEEGATVDTPAGRFTGCAVYITEGYYGLRVETAYCPGVGIVRQRVHRDGELKSDWRLSAYHVAGGEGYIPFATGNFWEYDFVLPTGRKLFHRNRYEAFCGDGERMILGCVQVSHIRAYDEDSWEDMMLQARREYVEEIQKPGEDKCERLRPVEEPMARALALAETPFQKKMCEIAGRVMARIHDTDPEYNPEYTESGRWNFFCCDTVMIADGKVRIEDSREFSFEWKNMGGVEDSGYPVLSNDVYEILSDAMNDCLWDDAWLTERQGVFSQKQYGKTNETSYELTEIGTVETPAGKFEGCVRLSLARLKLPAGWGYRGGRREYDFAPGVGLVRVVSHHKKGGRVTAEYVLADYAGVGEGYFPLADGFARRYEAVGLMDGWRASAEYTCVADGEKLYLLEDRLGVQARENYEADLAKA